MFEVLAIAVMRRKMFAWLSSQTKHAWLLTQIIPCFFN